MTNEELMQLFLKQQAEELAEIRQIQKIAEGAYSARTAHPFQRNGAPFRFKLSKTQQVD